MRNTNPWLQNLTSSLRIMVCTTLRSCGFTFKTCPSAFTTNKYSLLAAISTAWNWALLSVTAYETDEFDDEFSSQDTVPWYKSKVVVARKMSSLTLLTFEMHPFKGSSKLKNTLSIPRHKHIHFSMFWHIFWQMTGSNITSKVSCQGLDRLSFYVEMFLRHVINDIVHFLIVFW